jgi:WD40 repeat protein
MRLDWSPLFGYDFFISYKRGSLPDGSTTYARNLLTRLRSMDFQCFLDEHGAPPGGLLTASIKKGITRSRTLLVLCTPSAIASDWVKREVSAFANKRHAQIIPINFEFCIQKTNALEKLGLTVPTADQRIWLDELSLEHPSDSVVGAIQSAYTFHKANTLRLWFLSAMTIVLALVSVFAWSQWKSADWNATLATEQRLRAESRALAAAALLTKDEQLDLALLLSVESLKRADTFEAQNALFTVMPLHPRLIKYLHHVCPVNSVSFSPNGSLLATGSGYPRLWDVLSGKTIDTDGWSTNRRGYSDCSTPVHSVAFTRDGKLIASADNGGRIKLINIPSGQASRHDLYPSTIPYAVDFSPDGRTLASQGSQGITLWDFVSGDRTMQLKSELRMVSALKFSPDGAFLASAGDTARIDIWNAKRGQLYTTFATGKSELVHSLAFSPFGDTLAAGTYDGIRLWDVRNRKMIGHLKGAERTTMLTVAFSPTGTLVAGGDLKGEIWVWNVKQQTLAWRSSLRHRGQVNSIAFSPDGTVLASAGEDKSVRLWDTRGIGGVTADAYLNVVTFDSDRRLLVGSGDGVIRAWNTRKYEDHPKEIRAHDGETKAIAFDPATNLLASGGSDGRVRLWDATTFEPRGEFEIERGDILNLVFAPNGRYLAGVGYGHGHVWDLVGHKTIPELEGKLYRCVAFNRDGTLLATLSAGALVVMNMASYKVVGVPFRGAGSDIIALAFSPVGQLIASAGYESIRLWDLNTHTSSGGPLISHRGFVESIAFSHDGRLLASGGDDATIRLWQIDRHRPLGPILKGHAFGVTSLCFSPDGMLLGSAARHDRTARLWDVGSSSWPTKACQIANRDLTPEEWDFYLGSDIPYERTCPTLPEGPGKRQ